MIGIRESDRRDLPGADDHNGDEGMTRIGGSGRLLGREWERRLGHRARPMATLSRLGYSAGPSVLLFSVLEPIGWRAAMVRHERRWLLPARSVSCW